MPHSKVFDPITWHLRYHKLCNIETTLTYIRFYAFKEKEECCDYDGSLPKDEVPGVKIYLTSEENVHGIIGLNWKNGREWTLFPDGYINDYYLSE